MKNWDAASGKNEAFRCYRWRQKKWRPLFLISLFSLKQRRGVNCSSLFPFGYSFFLLNFDLYTLPQRSFNEQGKSSCVLMQTSKRIARYGLWWFRHIWAAKQSQEVVLLSPVWGFEDALAGSLNWYGAFDVTLSFLLAKNRWSEALLAIGSSVKKENIFVRSCVKSNVKKTWKQKKEVWDRLPHAIAAEEDRIGSCAAGFMRWGTWFEVGAMLVLTSVWFLGKLRVDVKPVKLLAVPLLAKYITSFAFSAEKSLNTITSPL